SLCWRWGSSGRASRRGSFPAAHSWAQAPWPVPPWVRLELLLPSVQPPREWVGRWRRGHAWFRAPPAWLPARLDPSVRARAASGLLFRRVQRRVVALKERRGQPLLLVPRQAHPVERPPRQPAPLPNRHGLSACTAD